jgi:lysophospholipase L1-like esterase
MRILQAAIAAALAMTLAAPAGAQQPPPRLPQIQAPYEPGMATGIVADPCADRQPLGDWPYLCRYRADNAAAPPPAAGQPRVVFIGDSITEGWRRADPEFFEANGYIGRGISAQTTQHMLVRFQPDVVNLKPQVVHIMAGVNDIAGNSGPTTMAAIQDNVVAMTTLARANGIRVVIASVMPAGDFPWRKGMNPAPRIVELNAWLKAFAAREGFAYADYHTVMADSAGAMKPGLAGDGVHPNKGAYDLIEPITQRAIAEALARQGR